MLASAFQGGSLHKLALEAEVEDLPLSGTEARPPEHRKSGQRSSIEKNHDVHPAADVPARREGVPGHDALWAAVCRRCTCASAVLRRLCGSRRAPIASLPHGQTPHV